MSEQERQKNQAAVELGKLARGRPKRISVREREARRQRAAYARECRVKKRREKVPDELPVFPPDISV